MHPAVKVCLAVVVALVAALVLRSASLIFRSGGNAVTFSDFIPAAFAPSGSDDASSSAPPPPVVGGGDTTQTIVSKDLTPEEVRALAQRHREQQRAGEPPFAPEQVLVVSAAVTEADREYAKVTWPALSAYCEKQRFGFAALAPEHVGLTGDVPAAGVDIQFPVMCRAVATALLGDGAASAARGASQQPARFVLWVAPSALVANVTASVEAFLLDAKGGDDDAMVIGRDFQGLAALFLRVDRHGPLRTWLDACLAPHRGGGGGGGGFGGGGGDGWRRVLHDERECAASAEQMQLCATARGLSARVEPSFSAAMLLPAMSSFWEEHKAPWRHRFLNSSSGIVVATLPQCGSALGPESHQVALCTKLMAEAAQNATAMRVVLAPQAEQQSSSASRPDSLSRSPPPLSGATTTSLPITTTTTTLDAGGESLDRPLRIALVSVAEYPEQEALQWDRAASGKARSNSPPNPEILSYLLHRYGWQNKRDYAAKHGYTFIIENSKSVGEHRHPAFAKTKAVRKWLPHFDYVVALDTDTLITNPNLRVEDQVLRYAVEEKTRRDMAAAKQQQQQQQQRNAPPSPPEKPFELPKRLLTPADIPPAAFDYIVSTDQNGRNTQGSFYRNSRRAAVPSNWTFDFLDRVDRGPPPGTGCGLPAGWFEQSDIRCWLGESHPRSKSYDDDMKHVFDIPPDQIRRMQSFFPPLHVGNSAVMWRSGDFLAHFPDCKSHAPACMMQFKAAVRDLALPRKVDVNSFTDFPVPPRLRVPF